MNCAICEKLCDERSTVDVAHVSVCQTCRASFDDVELLEKLGYQTLPFEMFKDSFVQVCPQAGEEYAGFQGEDLGAAIWWSDDTQCMVQAGPDHQCVATVGNMGCAGLFDHCAAFIYVQHYLPERAAGLSGDDDELHHIARCFMGVWAWPQISFDEWYCEHMHDLNHDASVAASNLLEMF